MGKNGLSVRFITISIIVVLLSFALSSFGCGNRKPVDAKEYILVAISIYQKLERVGDLRSEVSDEVNLHNEKPEQVSFTETCDRISELYSCAQAVFQECLAGMEQIEPPSDAVEIHEYLISFYEDIIPLLEEAETGFLYASKVMNISDYINEEAINLAIESRTKETPEERIEYYDESIAYTNTYIDVLGEITPPAIAEEFHEILNASLNEAVGIFAELREAVASGNDEMITGLEEELVAVFEKFTAYVYEENFMNELFDNLDYIDERIYEAGERIDEFCYRLEQEDTKKLIEKSVEEMSKVTGFYTASEFWYERDYASKLDRTSESYISLPDKRHVVFKMKNDFASDALGDTIVEEWYIAENKYVRFGDGRITKVENDLPAIFLELELLRDVSDPIYCTTEEIIDKECFLIEAVINEDLQNPEKGYHKVTFYIDTEEYLLRKVIFETSPIRTQENPGDKGNREWTETIYEDYNVEFEITPPTVTE